MAIYHLAVKSVSRSTGRSAVAAIAYRAGVELVNERDGLVHDYTRRGGVEDVFIVVPEGAEWAQDRSALWNAAERSEEHTSELQSLMRISYAVFCLKKKKQDITYHLYRTSSYIGHDVGTAQDSRSENHSIAQNVGTTDRH